MLTTLYNTEEKKSVRRLLRQSMPKGERLLWSKLKANQLGYKFKRQYSIGSYIVDFYAPTLKLCIEIDGRTHDYDDQAEYDNRRQKYLESIGIIVERFNSKEIFDNIDSVVEKIWITGEEIKNNKK